MDKEYRLLLLLIAVAIGSAVFVWSWPDGHTQPSEETEVVPVVETKPQTQESAQPSTAQAVDLPVPVLPLLVAYEYIPHYFMQWIDDHPQYARIEAAVYDGDPKVFNLVLTDKSGRRVNYCNSEEKVKSLKSDGLEARFTKIEYRAENQFGQLPAHQFSFTDERGQSVRWQFTLAAPASERGAGLTPQEGGQGWLIIYRDLGSAAGEGTAVQIGNHISQADAWTEISAPPYFVAYRGVYAEGIGIGIVHTGQEAWRAVSSPKELSEGAEWTLTDDRGRTRRLRIVALRGDEVTIKEVSASQLSIQARRIARGLALQSLALTSRSKTMRIRFNRELDLQTPGAVAFQIDLNGEDKLIQGSVVVERKDGEAHLRWQPKSPDWAKSRPLTSTLVMKKDEYRVEVK